MKKVLLTIATISMVALVASCNKESGNDDPKKEDPKVEEFEVAIDGSYADWDALTTDKVTEKDVIATPTGISEPTATSIPVIKATSDDQYVYMYVEVSPDKIFFSDKAVEGDSWDGIGDSTPGPVFVYLDLDANPATGCHTDHTSANEPYIDGIGVDLGVELYLYLDTKTNKVHLGWSQVTVVPEGAPDGDPYQANWWGKGYTPDGGYDHELDNLCPSRENFKAAFEGGVIKIEFAMERSFLAQNTRVTMGNTIVFAARNESSDNKGGWGLSGLIPATTLKLAE